MADSQRKSYNLFDKNATDTSNGYEANHYLDGNGDSGASSNHNISEYIDISQYSTITISGADTSSYAIQNTFYNANKEKISHFPCNTMPKTVTVPNNAKYIRLTITKSRANEMMLISGSIPKPYEAYGAWVHSLRKLTTATEAVENPLYTDGTAITSYTIKGNTVQSGTPTPSNPITISGVGNKTANLLYANVSTTFNGNNCSVTTTANTSEVILNATSYNTDRICAITGLAINLKAGTYTACVDGLTKYSGVTYDRYYLRKSDTTVLVNNIMTDTPQTFTITEDTEIDRIVFVLKADTEYTNKKIKLWVMEGSTPKPYEPYGYKIPISTLQGSAVNYLGNVQSTRQIKKFVLKGDEYWVKSSGSNPDDYLYHLDIGESQQGAISDSFCTHEPYSVQYPTGDTQGFTFKNYLTGYRLFYINVGSAIMNAQASGNTVNGFKEYLQAQYAVGTPVTIWYAVSTSETGIVNEPLMKIGTYYDIISNAISIPTTDGANSITVDTTVQPSEFTATWTGWHDASVKEKSENLFDYEYYFDNKVNTGGSNDWLAYQLEPNTAYTVSCNVPYVDNLAQMFVSLSNTSPTTANNGVGLNNPRTITTDSTGVLYILSRGATAPSPLVEVTKQLWEQSNWWLMLNSGQTALPYEPFWK